MGEPKFTNGAGWVFGKITSIKDGPDGIIVEGIITDQALFDELTKQDYSHYSIPDEYLKPMDEEEEPWYMTKIKELEKEIQQLEDELMEEDL